jgi:acetyl esterase/lipase
LPIQITKIAFALLALIVLLGAIVACSPLTAINALTPSSTYRKTANIAYGTDSRHQLDVYSPTAQNSNALAPVVVFFYGGNWNAGSRSDYEFIGEVAWTAREIKKYGGDPQRLFVMGHSAGAYNAAMVALDRRLLSAYGMTPQALSGWIGLAGPYDFIPIENQDTQPVFFHPNTPPKSQPINQVTDKAPPALLIASNKDHLVNPVRNTGGMAKRLREAEVSVTEIYYDKTSHTTLVAAMSRPLRGLAPVLDAVEQFVFQTSCNGER